MRKYETPIVDLEIFGARDVVSASKPISDTIIDTNDPGFDSLDPAYDSNWTDRY